MSEDPAVGPVGLWQAIRNTWGEFKSIAACLRCRRTLLGAIGVGGVPIRADGQICRWFIEGTEPFRVYGPGIETLPGYDDREVLGRFTLCEDCAAIVGPRGMVEYDSIMQDIWAVKYHANWWHRGSPVPV